MKSESPSSRTQARLCLASIAVLAFALRFFALGGAPLIPEEKWTLAQAAGFSFVDLPPSGRVVDSTQLVRWTSVREILHRIGAFDQPLFILLAHASIEVFGVSEWALRLLPALLGALSPLLLYLWARRLVDAPTALLAAALLAVHPFHVGLSRYARVYSVAIALLLLGYLIPHRWRDRRMFSPTALFLGVQPLTHMLSGFAAIPHLIQLRFVDRVRRRQILASVSVGLLILACALPFGLADSILSEHRYTGLAHTGISGALAFAPEPLAAATALAVTALLGVDLSTLGGRTRDTLPLMALLILACIHGARGLRGPARLVLVTGSVLPLLVALVLSASYGHLVALLPRYSVWCLPFVLVLLASGLRRLQARSTLMPLAFGLYFAIDLAMLRAQPAGLKLDETARLAACSSESSPLSVDEPVDAFVAGAVHRDRVYFLVRSEPTGQGPTLSSRANCR